MLNTDIAWRPLPGSQTLALSCPAHVIVYHGTRGPGKRVSSNTPVLTDSGWKNAGNVTYEDKLVALDGTYTEVTGIFPCVDRALYNVEFFDGAVVEADDEHRWLTLNCHTGYREGGFKVRTTKQLRTMSTRCAVPYLQGAIPGKQWQGPDPYLIGYIIANGTTGSKNVTIYSIDDEILEYVKNIHSWHIYEYEATARRGVCPAPQDLIWRNVLGHKVGDQKCIPPELLTADPETRLARPDGR